MYKSWFEVKAYPSNGGGLSAYFLDITDRKQLGEDLRASEQRYRSLAMATSQIVWTTERSGEVGEDSISWRAFTGQSFEQWQGSGWANALHPDDRERTLEGWHRSVADRLIYDSEYRLRRADGEYRWTAVRAVPVFDPDGSVREWVGTNTDITDHKRTFEALRQHTAQFETLLNAAPLGIFLIDADFCLREANPIALAVFNNVSNAIGKDFSEVLHILWPKDHADEALQRFRHTRDTGESFIDLEWTEDRQDLDGRQSYEWQIHRIPLADGRYGVVCYFRDLSAQVLARLAIMESEDRFRTLADNISQFAWMTDGEGSIFWYNRRWFDYTGTTLEEMQGWGWRQVHHPDHVDRVVEKFQLQLAVGEPWEDTFPLRGKDGTYRWFLSRAQPIRDDAGQVTRWIGTNTDVTESRLAKEALQENDRLKDEFLAMLAHELRNPLAAISNAVQLMKRTDSKESREWSQEMIEAQIKNLSRMVDDLLDVSRITRGKIQLRKQYLDLLPIINSAIDSARPLIEERRHRLVVDLVPESLLVEGDPTRLEQVLVNLLNNAAKYTESSGRITLSAQTEGPNILITIVDTGVGMTPELLARAFDLFAQSDRTIARSEGGLGIGLTLVKSLVEMHNGTVTAESRGPGHGSRFTIRLPLARKQTVKAVKPLKPTSTSAKNGSKVLVVDDNMDTARGMARLLKLLGHEVRVAHDGPSALEEARSHRPDIVLLDIGLPGMDGYQVARSLRDEGFDQTIIIAISGYGEEQARLRSREAGFDSHLVKPVDFDSLVALIQRPR